MADIPKKIFNSTITDQAYFDKYSIQLGKSVNRLLDKAQQDVVAALAKNDPTAQTMTKWKQARLTKLNKDIDTIVTSTYKQVKDMSNKALIRAGGLQAKTAVASINKAVGADIFGVTLEPATIKAIIGNTMIGGKTIGEWWDNQSASTKSKLSAAMKAGTQALQIGMVQGESIGQLVARIRGSATTPGVMSLTKREATALARTSVMQVSGAVRQELYKANADVLKGFQWVSTLDNRTTPQCRMMDGKEYDMDMNPIGHSVPFPGCPAHWNCFPDGKTPIYTSKGWKRISKIEVGDLVLTHKGRFRKVTELIFTSPDYYPEVAHVKLKGYGGIISATTNHPFLINERWLEIGKAKVGDKTSFLSHKCANAKCDKMTFHSLKYCSQKCSSNDHIGYEVSEITREKISKGNKGKIISPETIKKMIATRWTEEKRKKQSEFASKQMLDSYESGLRDRFAVTMKAHEATRKMIKNGTHPLQIKEVRDKGRNAQRTSVRWKTSILNHMINHNPGSLPHVRKLTSERMLKQNREHPELHPNVIMAQKGFISGIEKKMKAILDSFDVAYIQQCPIAGKYADFAIPDLKIVIEVDGVYWHKDKESDDARQKLIEDEGWQVFRFTEKQINKEFESVKAEVLRISCNHAEVYQFADFEIEKIERVVLKKKSKLYNFSVEEDESYIAKGFVVHNCRSTIVPITKSWAELSGPASPLTEKQIAKLDNIPIGMRASMGGPIPADITYQDWLLDQDITVQQDILGQSRYKLWKQNKLDVGDLVTDTGHSLTIDELERKFATRYKLAADTTDVMSETSAVMTPDWVPLTSNEQAFTVFKEKFNIDTSVMHIEEKIGIDNVNAVGRAFNDIKKLPTFYTQSMPALNAVDLFDSVAVNMVKGKGASACYFTKSKYMAVGTKNSLIDSLHLGAYDIGGDVASAVRHEYGHHIFYHHLDDASLEKWRKIWNKNRKGTWWADNVSTYAATDFEEALAESFSAYTSPLYGTAANRTLPKVIEEYFDEAFGKAKVNISNLKIDTSNMPLSRGALWSDLQDKEYRDMLIRRAEKGEIIEIVPQIEKLNEFATNKVFLSTEKETVYFGLDGEKFANLKKGNTFESLGTRSTSLTLERAKQYAGDTGTVFQLEIPKGMVSVNANVLGIEERMLLPGSKFEVIGKTGNVIKLRLIEDGSSYIRELYSFQNKLTNLVTGSKEPLYKISEKVAKARASHLPATREVQIIAKDNQTLAALKTGGVETSDNAPFDIIVGKNRIELKTIVRGKNDKITMHPESLERKMKDLKDNAGSRAHTLVIDERTGKVYYAEGCGSFRLSTMTEIGTKNNFGPNLLKIMKGQPIKKELLEGIGIDAKNLTGPIKINKSMIKIDKIQDYDKGTNSSVRVVLSNGNRGLYKPIIGEKPFLRADIKYATAGNMTMAHREVLAYNLSKELGFNFVPETRLIDAIKGIGSLQSWEEGCTSGAKLIKKGIEVELSSADKARVSIFDALIGNEDRHKFNWIFNQKTNKMYLIDNGLSFPQHTETYKTLGREIFSTSFSPLYIFTDMEYAPALRKELLGILEKINIKKIAKDLPISSEEIIAFEKRRNVIMDFLRGKKNSKMLKEIDEIREI